MITRTMITVMMVVLAITATYAGESAKPILPPEVEKAVLAEDWDKVAELIGKVTPETSAVLRLMKAHACLATNRNNESVGLFSVVTFGDLEELTKWCKNIAAVNKNQPLINYFLGDIHARHMDYEKAIELFTKEIEQDENSFLALNARGAVYIILEEYDKAIKDLIGAKAIKPDFSDVYNNLAMINIRQRKGLIDNSKNSFLAVLKVNPDFALAYHGLGCLELLESKNIAIPEENLNIQKAIELLPETIELLISNETKYFSATYDKQAGTLLAKSGEEGAYLKKEFKIQQLTNKYNNHKQRQSNTDLNILQRMTSKVRSMVIQDQLAKQASTMTIGEVKRFTFENPEAAGVAFNAISKAEKRTSAIEAYFKGNPKENWIGSTLVSSIPGFGGPLSRGMDAWTSYRIKGAQQSHMKYQIAKKKFVEGQDYSIKKHLKGSFDGKSYNVTHVSGKVTSYTPFSMKTPQSISHGIPGDRNSINNFRPAGATTDKALITWNDGEWPFDPIIGLLYQIPQTVSGKNQLNTEGEK